MPDGGAIQGWLLSALPHDDIRYVRLSIGWTWHGPSQERALSLSLERMTPQHAVLSELRCDAWAAWMRALPEVPRFFGEIASLALLAHWCCALSAEAVVMGDAERSFFVYGFDWQDPRSIFHIGDADACEWRPPAVGHVTASPLYPRRDHSAQG